MRCSCRTTITLNLIFSIYLSGTKAELPRAKKDSLELIQFGVRGQFKHRAQLRIIPSYNQQTIQILISPSKPKFTAKTNRNKTRTLPIARNSHASSAWNPYTGTDPARRQHHNLQHPQSVQLSSRPQSGFYINCTEQTAFRSRLLHEHGVEAKTYRERRLRGLGGDRGREANGRRESGSRSGSGGHGCRI